MGFLKRFNREQLTLGVAGLLSALLFGWQLARSGGDGSGGKLPENPRVYSIGRQSPIEFLDAKVEEFVKGRDFWEPPAAGRLPIPEIRPPEPKLGQMVLPPMEPRPDDAEFNLQHLPGKFRSVNATVQATVPAGFPPEADIVALKSLVEPDLGGVVDKRKQLMRPDGTAVIHRIKPNPPVVGRIVLDSDESPDGSISVEVEQGTGKTRTKIMPDEIDRFVKDTDEGVERGHEYEKEYKKRAKRLKDGDAEGHRKLGDWCRLKAGMLPEARTELLATVEALRKRGEVGALMRGVVLDLVEILREFGSYEEAISIAQAYIESVKGTANETADLHLVVGRLFAKLGYHERSLICYEAAFQLEPGRAPPRIALARARLKLGETKLALEQIDALFVAGAPADRESLTAARTVQGLARLRLGQAPQAEESFLAALSADPTNSEALNGLGVALALMNKPEAAQRFLAAIKANQYQIEAWLNLAVLYLAAGRPVEAEVLISGAAQRDPDSSTAAAGPGFLAALTGKYADAVPAFERARKIQPDDYFIAFALGRLKLREGRAQDALQLFRDALKSNPEYLPATTDAALAYLMLAREELLQGANAPADKQAPFRDRAASYRVNARTLLEAAFRADPTSLAANAALGCVYAAIGNVREANAAFDRATESGKADPLIDYGRGYVEYWYGADSPKARLDLAEVRFRYGASHQDLKDPADLEWKNECLKALQSIEDWRTQRVLIEDGFTGGQPAITSWIVVNGTPQPLVTFANDRANIGDSTGASPPTSFAALQHIDLPRDSFLSIEGTLIYEASQGFESGISLYTSPLVGAGTAATATGIHFEFLEDTAGAGPKSIVLFSNNTPMPAALARGPTRPTMRLGALPAAPSRVRFKLERKEHATEARTWLFDFSVWDDAKKGWRLLTEKNPIKVTQSQAQSPTMIMQFWGRTLTSGRKWSLGVDDVRVLVVEKQ